MLKILRHCTAVHLSHDLCNFTSAESFRWIWAWVLKTFKTSSPLYPDWDRPFEAQNENKTCQVIVVSKNNEHVVLSSDEISFGVDDNSFPNAMWVMAENKPKLSDFNRGFASPKEWQASNFSLQYHPWIKHGSHENRLDDHQLKQLLIVHQILLVSLKAGRVSHLCVLFFSFSLQANEPMVSNLFICYVWFLCEWADSLK